MDEAQADALYAVVQEARDSFDYVVELIGMLTKSVDAMSGDTPSWEEGDAEFNTQGVEGEVRQYLSHADEIARWASELSAYASGLDQKLDAAADAADKLSEAGFESPWE